MYNSPFKWWVQSVMPVVFDDSLSYYEVLAKLTKYIEGLTGDVQEIEKVLETIDGIGDVTEFTRFLETIQAEIGNLNNLQTASKNNLVNAINEVALKANIAYKKPPTGIPESDLDQSVRDKLNQSGETAEYIINNKTLKKAPNNNSPADLGLGTYSVPDGGIPWDTLSEDVKERINSGGGGTGGTKDYTELINKPQINGHTLNAGNNTLENLGIGTYNKPEGGIPESDLDAEVQEKLNTSGGIAGSETDFVATKDYEAGELFYINGVLYKAKNKILSGTSLVPGNNIEETDINVELENINNKIDAMASGEGLDNWSLVYNVTIANNDNSYHNFFEYVSLTGGESYLFIITPTIQQLVYDRGYIIRCLKRDGTVVKTEAVNNSTNYENQYRFTFIPDETGEYYFTVQLYTGGGLLGAGAKLKIELEYTQSQGMTELWTKVNEASNVVEDVNSLEILVGEHQIELEDINERIETLEDETDNLKSALNVLTVKLTAGHFISTNGNDSAEIQTFSISDYIKFSKDDKFEVFNFANSSASSYALGYAFYTEDKTYIANSGSGNFDGHLSSDDLTIPINSAYVRFSTRTSEAPDAVVYVYNVYGVDASTKKDLDAVQNDLDETTEYMPKMFPYTEETGFYNDTCTHVDSSTSHCKITDYIPCVAGEKFSYIGRADILVKSAYFFDENKVLKNVYQVNSQSSPTTITIPIGIKFVRFQSYYEGIAYPVPFFVAKYSADPAKDSCDLLAVEVESTRENKPFSAKIYTISDKIVNIYGTFNNAPGYNCLYTDLIPCDGSDVFSYQGVGSAPGASAVYYDKYRIYRGYFSISSPNDFTDITIPNEIKFVKFTSFSASTPTLNVKKKSAIKIGVEKDIKDIKNQIDSFENIGFGNVLFGKKYIACGDSFTHGDWTGVADEHAADIWDSETQQYKTYPWWIAKRNEMNFTNLAVNGQTLVYFASSELYKSIPVDADYCTIMYGLNDASNHITVGDVTDTTAETFCGAWYIVLKWLLDNRPALHYGVLIVADQLPNAYRDATKNMCQRFGVPYLDFYNDVKVPMVMGKYGALQEYRDIKSAQMKVSETNGHPNELCHQIESTFIEHFIRGL